MLDKIIITVTVLIGILGGMISFVFFLSNISRKKNMFRNENLKKDYIGILISIIVFIFSIFWIFMASSYQKAEELFDYGNYYEAAKYYESAYFYKDSIPMHYYSLALNAVSNYESEDVVRGYLNKVPKWMKCNYSTEIKTLENQLKDGSYEKICLEHSEQLERENAEFEQEKERISKIIPYVGMDTKYINYTYCGYYDELFHDKNVPAEYHECIYKWRSKDGHNRTILVVKSRLGKVYEVNKEIEYMYWKNDMPVFCGRDDIDYDMLYRSTFNWKSKGNENEREVDAYDDPEDYADDYADDFDSWDDAYDYWDDNN